MKWLLDLPLVELLNIAWGVVAVVLIPLARAAYREWKRVRCDAAATRALVLILGNRERRALDFQRGDLHQQIRRLWAALPQQDRERIETLIQAGMDRAHAITEIAPQIARLEELLKSVDELRDSGLRSKELRAVRERRDREFETTGWSPIEIDQGDLDAGKEGVFREEPKKR